MAVKKLVFETKPQTAVSYCYGTVQVDNVHNNVIRCMTGLMDD